MPEKDIDEEAVTDLMAALVQRTDAYIMSQEGHVPDFVEVEFERRSGTVNTRAKVKVEFVRGPDRCS